MRTKAQRTAEHWVAQVIQSALGNGGHDDSLEDPAVVAAIEAIAYRLESPRSGRVGVGPRNLTKDEARAVFVAAKLIADSDAMDDWGVTERAALQRGLGKIEAGYRWES